MKEMDAKSALGAILDKLRIAYESKEAAASVLESYRSMGNRGQLEAERLKEVIKDANRKIAQAEASLAPFQLASKQPTPPRFSARKSSSATR